MRTPALLLSLACTLGQTGQAQGLVELFDAARGYDAGVLSARRAQDAAMARAAQADAGLLPNVAFATGVSASQQDNQGTPYLPEQNFNYQTQTAGVTATQPLYRPANRLQREQGERQIDVAAVQLRAAEQDLLLRLSQAYFDVLAASDSLDFTQSQKRAVGEQLASAQRNFELGSATIVDTRDAQARYDLVLAQELATQNALRVKSLALEQLVGRDQVSAWPLRSPTQLPALLPDKADAWVLLAQDNSPALRQLELGVRVAELETAKAQAAGAPTLDLVGSYNASNALQGSSNGPANFDASSKVASLGLSLNFPLYNGRAVENRVRETLALEDKARSDLLAMRRNVAQATRSAFYDAQSGLAQVHALEAAEVSSAVALQANLLGYQVGIKINIDVLNAQSQLYDTKAKLARARYDVLMAGLHLRQTSGTLQADDLLPIEALLTPR